MRMSWCQTVDVASPQVHSSAPAFATTYPQDMSKRDNLAGSWLYTTASLTRSHHAQEALGQPGCKEKKLLLGPAYQELSMGKGQGLSMPHNGEVQHHILQTVQRLHASSSQCL